MLQHNCSPKAKNMNITLTYEALYATVDRSLSVIGKRSTDDDGNLLFTDITLSSREVPIIHDYFRQAAIDLAAGLSGFITAGSDTSITLAFPSNHNAALDSFIQKSCEAYCTSFALYSWFTVTAPRIAEKYQTDCNRQLSAVIRLSHEKLAPNGTADILSTSTSIT